MTVLAPETIPVASARDEDELTHVVHAACPVKPLMRFCGSPASGEDVIETDDVGPNDCVVCLEVELDACPWCGQ